MSRAYFLRYDQTILALCQFYTKEIPKVSKFFCPEILSKILFQLYNTLIIAYDNNVVHIYNEIDAFLGKMMIKYRKYRMVVKITLFIPNYWMTVRKLPNHERVNCFRSYNDLCRLHTILDNSPQAKNLRGCLVQTSSSISPCQSIQLSFRIIVCAVRWGYLRTVEGNRSASEIVPPVHLLNTIWLGKMGESLLEVDVVLEDIFFFQKGGKNKKYLRRGKLIRIVNVNEKKVCKEKKKSFGDSWYTRRTWL